MIYEVKPVEVPHESILALKLHQQALSADYERISKRTGGNLTLGAAETREALKKIEQKMLDCQKAEKWIMKRLHQEGLLKNQK